MSCIATNWQRLIMVFLMTAMMGLIIPALMAAPIEAPQDKLTPSLLLARQNVGHPLISPVSFRNMDTFFPSETVAAKPGTPLPTATVSLQFPDFVLGGKSYNFADALKATNTNALLVMKDGTLVHESYYNGAGPESRFIAWSISKSITSILLGIAMHEGKIESLQDTTGKYVPEARGTVFEDVSLYHMLQMQAGTSYREMAKGQKADIYTLKDNSINTGLSRFTDTSVLNLTRTSKPGTQFNYSTLTASMLGRVVEEATSTSLARYTEEKLWKPAGMQLSAYWILDGEPGTGQAYGGGGFNASARDLARIGQMMLNGGSINNKQIVPAKWVAQSTHYERSEAVIPMENRGYQFQWRTFLNTKIYEAIGVYGQYVSVDPATNTVIVKLSSWPEKGGLQYELDNRDLFTAIRKNVASSQILERN